MATLASKSKTERKQPIYLPLRTAKAFYQEEHTPSKEQYTDLERELIVAEYNALMTELNNRQNIRYQMVQLSLAALGALLTVSSVGIQNHLDSLILIYPVLVLLLSIIFITNAIETSKIKRYIETKLEILMPEIKGKAGGWQHHRKTGKLERLGMGTIGNAGSKAVFILTAFFAVGMGWQMMHHNQLNDILLNVSLGASIILTLLLSADMLYKLSLKLKH